MTGSSVNMLTAKSISQSIPIVLYHCEVRVSSFWRVEKYSPTCQFFHKKPVGKYTCIQWWFDTVLLFGMYNVEGKGISYSDSVSENYTIASFVWPVCKHAYNGINRSNGNCCAVLYKCQGYHVQWCSHLSCVAKHGKLDCTRWNDSPPGTQVVQTILTVERRHHKVSHDVTVLPNKVFLCEM